MFSVARMRSSYPFKKNTYTIKGEKRYESRTNDAIAKTNHRPYRC